MKAMFYNLLYGAWKDAAAEGVSDQWYVFTDNNHLTKDKHPLPQPPFLSDLFLLDPSNTAWQNYLNNENKKVYAALPFDGFHIDQLGDRGSARFTYNGSPLNLDQTFKPFIEAVKADQPQKYHVMNAVNQYGQQGIAQAPTDFLYTEVWDPNKGYADLAKVITDNNAFSNNTKNSVLAAYMNYNLADNKGFFNSPGVLLTDAVIFAFGGSHLELGEHMLGKEYFPNSNLQMKQDLKQSLVAYYDFLVAYQNLLRNGGTFNTVKLTSADYRVQLNNWPPATGQVSVVGKQVGNKQVLHLLNFVNANSLEWRDNSGTQTTPTPIENARFSFIDSKPIKKIWYASPDKENGSSKQLSFTQSGNQVNFTLPFLQYWDMLVIEYQ
jgi:dextranase